jgi:hypothetical protein
MVALESEVSIYRYFLKAIAPKNMNLYSQVIFPWCMDRAMSDPVLSEYRQQVL